MTNITAFYSPYVAFAFLVNFMLGTGVLTLPYAFANGGVLLASSFVLFFCIVGFVTATFELESMAIANAIRRIQGGERGVEEGEDTSLRVDDDGDDDDVRTPSMSMMSEPGGEAVVEDKDDEILETDLFALRERVELAEMLELFYGYEKVDAEDAPVEEYTTSQLRGWWKRTRRKNVCIVYFCNITLMIYLTGTMATYASLIASTFKNLITDTLFGMDAYYIFVALTVCIGTPLSFGNFQSTKYIQLLIMIARMSVFGIMVVTTGVYFFQGDKENEKGGQDQYPIDGAYYANPSGIASLYGNIVFTFMTHHSLPGLLSPIRPMSKIKTVLFFSLAFCCAAYVLLCTFAMLAFWNAPENVSDRCGDNTEPCQIMKTYNINFSSYHVKWIGDYIEGYPLLMLMLFPLIAITLRNNVRDFYFLVKRTTSADASLPALRIEEEVGETERQRRRGGGAPLSASSSSPLSVPFLGSAVGDGDRGEKDLADQYTPPATSFDRSTTMAVHKRRNLSSSNILFTAIAIVPGVAIAAALQDVQDITHYTGGFAGLMVMLVTPSLMVLRGRRVLRAHGIDSRKNRLRSPFASDAWAHAVLLFALCCFIYTVINVITGK